MIYCCRAIKSADKIIPLLDNNLYRDCFIEVGKCEKCNTTIAQLIQFNNYTRKKEIIRKPKKTPLDCFIAFYRTRQSKDVVIPVKSGNKSNMAFIFGKNLERKDKIEQYAVDFNGTEQLVKTIWKEKLIS